MNKPHFPDTILDQETSNKLLQALRVGVLDMAYFPKLYFPPIGPERDFSGISHEEKNRFHFIVSKIKFDNGGHITLTRESKIRLLNAIRVGRVNPQHDFPELGKAYLAVKQDWSAITDDEKEFILEICRKTWP